MGLSIDQIRQQVEPRGYTLVSSQIIGNSRQVTCLCPSGHTFTITLGNLERTRQPCKECRAALRAPNREFTDEDIRELLQKKNWECLGINGSEVSCRCANNHTFTVTRKQLRAYQASCRQCRQSKPVEKKTELVRLTDEVLQIRLAEKGLTFISAERGKYLYVNARCDKCGHDFQFAYRKRATIICPNCKRAKRKTPKERKGPVGNTDKKYEGTALFLREEIRNYDYIIENSTNKRQVKHATARLKELTSMLRSVLN